MFAQAAPSQVATAPKKSEHVLWLSLAGALIIKTLAAALFPLTGDEAYFIQWGRELAGSYYDHGPITGWLLWAFLQVSDAVVWLRVPAIVAPLLVALLLWWAWRRYSPDRAALAAALIAWSLPSMLNILTTTDTPLLVLSVASVVMAQRGDRTGRSMDYLTSGAFLGLAFLAKYFAVLIGLGLAVWWLGFSAPRRWKGLGLLLLGVAPSVAQHLYWNYHHSWTNVMFNVFTRNAGTKVNWAGPLVFVVMVAWLLGPILLAVFRQRKSGYSAAWSAVWETLKDSGLAIYLVTFAVPYAVLFFVSFVRPVGLHWLISFFPLGFALLLALFNSDEMERQLTRVMWFSFLHLVVGLVLILLPVTLAQRHKSYASIVAGMYPGQVLAAIAPYREGEHLATPSYARSALLEYHARQPVRVMGPGSFHGRQDDLRTDWRQLDGSTITFFTASAGDIERTAAWFDSTDVHTVEVRGAKFTVLAGRGFRYEAYRKDVLLPVADRYYTMPAWLERFSSGCFFRARYDIPPPDATPAPSPR